MNHLWIEQQCSATVVHFGLEYGSADLQSLCDLRKRLTQLAAEIESPQLVLDFSNTDYFGAGFISVLLGLYDQLKRRDGQFAICGLSSHLSGEVAHLKLDHLWPIFGSREEALIAMAATTA